ncbi:ribonuclease H-like protein [Aspergillus heteromorphus CBS 117.55]|uniref:Ribonuclease H-like protein n=1 Tax=Aspergillus heteromorphus CBS 117.55 TaxID=1448321 RepID=A0A317V8C4_9EURO|nr:ribonuclease H-like protein [Aspergillus heteromorphus CBS 117.55]PWY69551.1 ribonuclease H-like protein [Aspergillus heteromorphus CBS 117.55]
MRQSRTPKSEKAYQRNCHAAERNAFPPRSWRKTRRAGGPRRFYSSNTDSRLINDDAFGKAQEPEPSVLLANAQTLPTSDGQVAHHDPEPVSAQEPNPTQPPSADPPTPKFWSHQMFKSPEGKKIIVHYCSSLKSSEDVAQYFLNDKHIGFDMEWKAQASAWDSIQSNVSLIQIANRERIALFHIALFKPAKKLADLVPPTLKRIIESADITKLGVSIKADCTRLRKFLKIDARGIFELSHLHKLVKYCQSNPKLINKRAVNLSEQVEEHLGLPLEKDGDVRCSNWAVALNYRQVQYAASDPFACMCLFDTMDAKRRALDPMPPLPAHAELDLPIRIVHEPPVNADPIDVEVIKP